MVEGKDGATLHAYRVKELPVQMQPREMFDQLGAEHVPDESLLALLLQKGLPGQNVVELARTLLCRFGSSTGIARASMAQLTAIRGIGHVKAQQVQAAMEIARRLSREEVVDRPQIHTPEDAARCLREAARTLEVEVFWILLLDVKNRLMEEPVIVTKGTLTASLVHAREVFAPAISARAASVIAAHNHPSGDPSPSPEDLTVTRRLIRAGEVLQVPLLDHMILGRSSPAQLSYFCSLRESGLVSFSSERDE